MPDPNSPYSVQRISLFHQMISSMVGAGLTTFVTTPIEVIKTRLQTQLPRTDSHGILIARKSSFVVMKDIVQKEGVRTLWSGVSIALLMQIPSTVVYLGLYEEFRHRLHGSERNFINNYSPLLSGMSSRFLASFFISPLELIRTKTMYKNTGESMLQQLRSEVQLGGMKALWRGFTSTLLRDVPFSGIYWYGVENSRAKLWKMISKRDSSFSSHDDHIMHGRASYSKHSVGAHWFVSFLAGFISGSVAAFATTPFDVIKTRFQVQIYEKVDGKPGPSSPWSCMKLILREEGIPGLFRGLQMRLLRVGPSCAILISSYEVGKSLFSRSSLH